MADGPIIPTWDDVKAIRDAINTGAETVTFTNGRTVKYRSLADMRQIEADMVAQLEGGDSRPPVGVIRMGTSRGFGFGRL